MKRQSVASLVLFLSVLLVPVVAITATLQELPLTARYRISEAIGVEESVYHNRGTDLTGPRLHHPGQDLSAGFVNGAMRLGQGDNPLSMRLSRLGYGERMKAVAEPVVRTENNRVELQRRAIREWYVNGPLGLQQGFTLEAPPEVGKANGDELHLSLNLEGLVAAPGPKDDCLDLTSIDGSLSLNYSGLLAYDAKGERLPSRMAAEGSRIHLYVDDRQARYPITIDPLLQRALLTGEAGANDEEELQLGRSVDVAGDTVVVGAPGAHRDGVKNGGAVYVYAKGENGWSDMQQVARLTATDTSPGDLFGLSVAIDDSETIIIAGAPGYDGGGRVYLFKRPKNFFGPDYWYSITETAAMTVTGLSASADFGRSVAISGDNSIVAVGASGEASYRGTVFVFERPGTLDFWLEHSLYDTPAATLSPWGATYEFGTSVAVNGDGSRVVGGAPGDSSDKGALYYFGRPVSGWANKDFDLRLAASDSVAGDRLGTSVAIDGSTMAGGAPYHGTAGAVFLFTMPDFFIAGSNVYHTTKLLPSSVIGDATFGISVALNGSMAVAGTPFQAISGRTAQGQVHIFSKPGAGWPGTTGTPAVVNETLTLLAGDGAADDCFGWAVAVDDANTLVAGAAWRDNGSAGDQGAAYLFEENSTTQSALLTASQDHTDDWLGFSAAISGDTVVLGAPQHDTGGITDSGAAYVFLKENGAWSSTTPVALLYGDDAGLGAKFGRSVAIDGDTIVVGAPEATIGVNAKQGAAYIFSKPLAGWSGPLSQTAKFYDAAGAASSFFGYSVALDGDTIVVGAANEVGEGRGHVFVKDAEQPWTDRSTPTARLTGSNLLGNDALGAAAAIDGDIVILGAPQHDSSQNNQGAAYVYQKPAAGWASLWTPMEETAYLWNKNGLLNNNFGWSVVIEGDVVAVGVPRWGNDQGCVDVFQKPAAGWQESWIPDATFTPKEHPDNLRFGYSLALEGDLLLVGAVPEDVNQAGSAYLFRKNGASWSDMAEESEKLVGDASHPFDLMGAAVSLDGSTLLVGTPGLTVESITGQGGGYVFEASLFPWTMFLPAIIGR